MATKRQEDQSGGDVLEMKVTVDLEQAEEVDRQTVKISGEELKKVNSFKYLGAVMEENGCMEIWHRASAAWGHWKKCVVWQKSREAKGGDLQNSGKASRDMVNNEKPRRETGGEWDEDATMDVSSHEERWNQKRTSASISKVATAKITREKAKVVRTC